MWNVGDEFRRFCSEDEGNLWASVGLVSAAPAGGRAAAKLPEDWSPGRCSGIFSMWRHTGASPADV